MNTPACHPFSPGFPAGARDPGRVAGRAAPTAFAWVGVADEVGPELARHAADADRENRFVAESYAVLRQRRLFAAGVPAELGGGGAGHAEMCAVLRTLAHYCPATALAFAMHAHVMAAAVWRWKRGLPGEALLRRIAEQEAILVTTSANDWLTSNGTVERAEGGYRISARKQFVSGCTEGDLLVTSARWDDSPDGPIVMHLAVPMRAEGVHIEHTWDAHGMRGTGSHDVVFERVFVPEEAIFLRRPGGGVWHTALTVAMVVALPLIMSVYVGVAEQAAAEALAAARAAQRQDDITALLAGELRGSLATAQDVLRAMIDNAADYAFPPEIERADASLTRKAVVARATVAAVEKALELGGGRTYARPGTLERLLRDVRAGAYHPLPEKPQQRFTGRVALGLDPVG
jgi:alkylation response protein AidB-like acyl-CoA dehydrogenase